MNPVVIQFPRANHILCISQHRMSLAFKDVLFINLVPKHKPAASTDAQMKRQRKNRPCWIYLRQSPTKHLLKVFPVLFLIWVVVTLHMDFKTNFFIKRDCTIRKNH